MLKYNWKIVGHKSQLAILEKEIEERSIGNAYLFSGPPNIGKAQIAKTFANILECENEFCSACEVCRQIKKNIYPDVITVDKLYIDGKETNWDIISKSSNFNQKHRQSNSTPAKSDQISIEDVKSFVSRLYGKAQGRYKICLISNIERMTREATNSFLKILEEPPKNTIFIITTTNFASLLPTLISRCRIYFFSLISDDLIRKELLKIAGKDDSRINEILTISQGRFGIAKNLIQDKSAQEELSSYFYILTDFLENKNLSKKFQYIETLSFSSSNINKFIDMFIYFIRNILLKKISGKENTLAAKFKYKDILKLFYSVKNASDMLKKNLNKRLVLENLMLEIENHF